MQQSKLVLENFCHIMLGIFSDGIARHWSLCKLASAYKCLSYSYLCRCEDAMTQSSLHGRMAAASVTLTVNFNGIYALRHWYMPSTVRVVLPCMGLLAYTDQIAERAPIR